MSGRFLISAAMLRGPVFFSITASGPTRLYINGVLVPSMQTDGGWVGGWLTPTCDRLWATGEGVPLQRGGGGALSPASDPCSAANPARPAAATSGNVLTRTAGLALPKSGSLPIALDVSGVQPLTGV